MNTASASKLVLAFINSRNMPATNLWCTATSHSHAGSRGGQRESRGGTCLSNGMQVGKARQSLSTDIGDHVLVQGHIRSMHEVGNTTATAVLHHNPECLTPTPTALYTTPDLTLCFAHGGRGGRGLEVWRTRLVPAYKPALPPQMQQATFPFTCMYSAGQNSSGQ